MCLTMPVNRVSKILFAVPHTDLYPLLFILYVNDTTNVLDFILSADDTTILYSHENIQSQIDTKNIELKGSRVWFKANKIIIECQQN